MQIKRFTADAHILFFCRSPIINDTFTSFNPGEAGEGDAGDGSPSGLSSPSTGCTTHHTHALCFITFSMASTTSVMFLGGNGTCGQLYWGGMLTNIY